MVAVGMGVVEELLVEVGGAGMTAGEVTEVGMVLAVQVNVAEMVLVFVQLANSAVLVVCQQQVRMEVCPVVVPKALAVCWVYSEAVAWDRPH